MDELEALRTVALYKLGWLGKYEYRDLCITDQIYVDEQVEQMKQQ